MSSIKGKFAERMTGEFTRLIMPQYRMTTAPERHDVSRTVHMGVGPLELKEYMFTVVWKLALVDRTSTQRCIIPVETVYNKALQTYMRDMFGDFLEQLFIVDRALFNGDLDEASHIIQDIIQEITNVKVG